MGKASKRKKEQFLSIPKKPAREKPKGFAPVLRDDFFDAGQYDPMQHNDFLPFLRMPKNTTLNLPDNELFAACVCDGGIEGQSIWLKVFTGSIDECIDCLKTIIVLNYNKQLRGLGLEPMEWEAKHEENFERIKHECQKQGAAKVEWFWYIVSKEKSPHVFTKPEWLEQV
ncbi:hypothetical protein AB0758_32845 [Tolypothrix bouteillei VB521301_2]|uniref:Uncharacterized protein n=1 Tax=Tolypothrix bouteillei VB521301 TaxID=1479485 RepID=A0A0C1R8G2_9CYAN